MYKFMGDGKCDSGAIANTKTDAARMCLEYCKRKPEADFFSWDSSTTDCECYDASTCGIQSAGSFKSYKML